MSSLTSTAARGGALTLGVQVVRMVIQVLSVVVLARLLAPDVFGLIAMVTAVIGVAELVRDFGLSLASVQATHVSRAERDNLFWANTGLGTACAVAAAAATPLLVAINHEPRLGQIVAPLAGVFVLSGMTTQFRADLARRLRFAAVAFADLLAPAFGLGTAVVLGEMGAGIWALVAQQIVTAAVALLVNAVNARWLPRWYDRSVSIRRFFRFGIGVLGTQVLSYITRNVDYIVLGAFRGPEVLGLYSRAYQMLMVPLNQIDAPLTNVAVPVLARVQRDRVSLGRALRRAQLVSCYVTAPLLVIVAALSKPIVAVLLGVGWSGVAPILAVLALGGLFRSIAQVAYWMYLSTGSTDALLRLQLWTQPVMVVFIVSGMLWGATGVAFGHMAANIFYWVVSLIAVGRTTDVQVRPLIRTAVVAMLAVGAPAGLAAWYVSGLVTGPMWQLVAGLASALVAAVIVGMSVPPARRDLVVMVRLGRQVFGRPTQSSAGPRGC